MKYVHLGGAGIVELDFPKDPDSEIPFLIDWAPWLKPRSDTINTVETTSDDLTVEDVTKDNYTATIKLSGGTPGNTATVKQVITSAAGFKYPRRFKIRVEER